MLDKLQWASGFSDGVQWPWPIAVYLVLAGISGGAVIVAMMIRYYKKQKEITPIYKAASVVSFVTISCGMLFLVADLHRPLYFWKILIYYNPTSVMSLGVIGISAFIPLTMLLTIFSFEELIRKKLPIVSPILDKIKPFKSQIEIAAFVFAVIVCAYTGFLISVLVRFPILNTAILPALFVASGLSAGTAATAMAAKAFFKEDIHSPDMSILHKIEWPVLASEVLLLFMLIMGLVFGYEAHHKALNAFIDTTWGVLFWLGIVGIGFVGPVPINFFFNKKLGETTVLYLSGLCSIIGVLFLRIFILYAGQSFSIWS